MNYLTTVLQTFFKPGGAMSRLLEHDCSGRMVPTKVQACRSCIRLGTTEITVRIEGGRCTLVVTEGPDKAGTHVPRGFVLVAWCNLVEKRTHRSCALCVLAGRFCSGAASGCVYRKGGRSSRVSSVQLPHVSMGLDGQGGNGLCIRDPQISSFHCEVQL